MSFVGRQERQGRRAGRRWLGALGLAAGLIAIAPGQAHAQSSYLPEPGTYDVTPFIGFGFSFSDDAGSGVNDTAFALGGAFAYNWTTNLAVEGELAFIPDIFGDSDEADMRVTTISANGVYHFDTGSKVVPYATFGLGFGRTSADFTSLPDISRTEFAVNFGGGVKAPVAERLQVRGDLRYFAINDQNPSFWRLYGGVTFRLGH